VGYEHRDGAEVRRQGWWRFRRYRVGTLNRPQKRNDMNPTMYRDMVKVLNELQFDPASRILVLNGAGESWCAGQDLREFSALSILALASAQRTAEILRNGAEKLYTYPKPTIGSTGSSSAACELHSLPVTSRSFLRRRCFVSPRDPFDGKITAEVGPVNRAVPRALLGEETVALAEKLL
jgi:feruloyl-CoA hydratase/lyase